MEDEPHLRLGVVVFVEPLAPLVSRLSDKRLHGLRFWVSLSAQRNAAQPRAALTVLANGPGLAAPIDGCSRLLAGAQKRAPSGMRRLPRQSRQSERSCGIVSQSRPLRRPRWLFYAPHPHTRVQA